MSGTEMNEPAGGGDALPAASERHAVHWDTKAAATPDRLAYMADMLAELRVMAAAEKLDTLTGLLDLAQTEARRKAG